MNVSRNGHSHFANSYLAIDFDLEDRRNAEVYPNCLLDRFAPNREPEWQAAN
jgi:hypothetical protein